MEAGHAGLLKGADGGVGGDLLGVEGIGEEWGVVAGGVVVGGLVVVVGHEVDGVDEAGYPGHLGVLEEVVGGAGGDGEQVGARMVGLLAELGEAVAELGEAAG